MGSALLFASYDRSNRTKFDLWVRIKVPPRLAHKDAGVDTVVLAQA